MVELDLCGNQEKYIRFTFYHYSGSPTSGETITFLNVLNATVSSKFLFVQFPCYRLWKLCLKLPWYSASIPHQPNESQNVLFSEKSAGGAYIHVLFPIPGWEQKKKITAGIWSASHDGPFEYPGFSIFFLYERLHKELSLIHWECRFP